MRCEDLVEKTSANQKYLVLNITKSKTDGGAKISVECTCPEPAVGRDREGCPYHRVHTLWSKRSRLGGDAMLFSSNKKEYQSEIATRLKSLLPSDLQHRCSSHSMRRSGAMAMINGGVSLARVSELGRWTGTETLVKNYLRGSSKIELEQAKVARVCWVEEL